MENLILRYTQLSCSTLSPFRLGLDGIPPPHQLPKLMSLTSGGVFPFLVPMTKMSLEYPSGRGRVLFSYQPSSSQPDSGIHGRLQPDVHEPTRTRLWNLSIFNDDQIL